MSDYVVLRLEGEGAFWLVDFASGSVTPIDGDAKDLAGADRDGGAVVKGVDVAVLARARGEAASQKLWSAA
jgi:hypothetical protein